MTQSLYFSSESLTHTHRPPGQRSNSISWYKNNHKCSKSQSDRKSVLSARPRGRSQQPKCLSFTFPPEESHLDRWVCLQQIKTNIKNKRNDDEAVPTAARSNTNTTPRKTRHPETVWRQSRFKNWFRVSDRKQTSETFRIKLERRSESFQDKVFNAATSVSIYTINIPAKRLKTRTKWAEGQKVKSLRLCRGKKKKRILNSLFQACSPSGIPECLSGAGHRALHLQKCEWTTPSARDHERGQKHAEMWTNRAAATLQAVRPAPCWDTEVLRGGGGA